VALALPKMSTPALDRRPHGCRSPGATFAPRPLYRQRHVATIQETRMINKDEVKGKAEQVKGSVKQGLGKLTDNPELVEEGQADEAEGKVRETAGTARRKVGDAVEKVGAAIKR